MTNVYTAVLYGLKIASTCPSNYKCANISTTPTTYVGVGIDTNSSVPYSRCLRVDNMYKVNYTITEADGSITNHTVSSIGDISFIQPTDLPP